MVVVPVGTGGAEVLDEGGIEGGGVDGSDGGDGSEGARSTRFSNSLGWPDQN